jgi:hypothetical protein
MTYLQMEISVKRSKEFEKFDNAMEQLLKVPHSEIKKKLDAEKAEKAKKRKAKKSSAASQEKLASD